MTITDDDLFWLVGTNNLTNMSRATECHVKDSIKYYSYLYQFKLELISSFLGESSKVDSSNTTFLAYYRQISKMLDTSEYEADEDVRKLSILIYLVKQFDDVLDSKITSKNKLLIPIITFPDETHSSFEEEKVASTLNAMNYVGFLSALRGSRILVDLEEVTKFISESEKDETKTISTSDSLGSENPDGFDLSILGELEE